MDLLHINEVFFCVFLLFVISFIIQMVYWWNVYGKLAFYRKRASAVPGEPISIVLIFNDELEKLKAQLPALLSQQYPDFEVVLVIQSKNDDLVEYLDQVGRDHPNVKVVEMMQDLNFFKGSKFALSIGIKSARNDLLVLTEAGCMPASDRWLEQIQSNTTSGKEVVLGYSRPSPHSGGPLKGFRRFAGLMTAVRYFSFALAGQPYMGIGKNLSYRKSLFYRHQGFMSHYRIPVGEDDLFINRVATKKNVAVALNTESQVVCESAQSFTSWIRFQKRYFRTRRHYNHSDRFNLNLYFISFALFLLAFAFLLVVKFLFWTVIAIFIIRLFSQLTILKKCMNQLNEKKLLVLSPLNEVLLMVLDGLVRISMVFDKKEKWKT